MRMRKGRVGRVMIALGFGHVGVTARVLGTWCYHGTPFCTDWTVTHVQSGHAARRCPSEWEAWCLANALERDFPHLTVGADGIAKPGEAASFIRGYVAPPCPEPTVTIR